MYLFWLPRFSCLTRTNGRELLTIFFYFDWIKSFDFSFMIVEKKGKKIRTTKNCICKYFLWSKQHTNTITNANRKSSTILVNSLTIFINLWCPMKKFIDFLIHSRHHKIHCLEFESIFFICTFITFLFSFGYFF